LAQRDPLYEAIGRRVRAAREQAKRSQGELAQRVGLTRTSITNIERGRQKIQVHTLYAIAEALNVRPDALLPLDVVDGSGAIDEQLPKELPTAEREWVKRVLGPKAE
jgi:transcriptional regulator with XRE-family HTH domain